MGKKIILPCTVLLLLLYSINVYAQEVKNIEIFDPKQNKVVKIVKSNPQIQNMVRGWVMNIQGMCSKVDPVTDEGYAVKIPLDPAVKVRSKYLNATVNEVFLIIPEKDPPFFLIFEKENKLSCFLFNGNIDMLSSSLGFNLRNKR